MNGIDDGASAPIDVARVPPPRCWFDPYEMLAEPACSCCASLCVNAQARKVNGLGPSKKLKN
ncbi:hypothetical protein Scep_024613 [Stephania cephalantha]|uniref:Uncharacterized protein n=1 Tax=Stephania cephalantha TaxID=152367 RepID=A0AAP0F445_9MAGN